MTLWRLERLRLLRTHRWVVLLGIYAALGVLGALSARFMSELIGRVGGEITITMPDPRPVDGLTQFVGNASQLGLLAVVVVAAAALAIDAHPARSAFLRTRTRRPGWLIVPAYTVTMLASMAALTLGTLVTWVLTAALIGPLPASAVIVGTAYGGLYLAFAIALVAVVASLVRGQLATVLTSLGALIALPVLSVVDVLRPWLPSELLTAVVPLAEGVAPGEYLRAAIVAVLASTGLLALAIRRLDGREL